MEEVAGFLVNFCFNNQPTGVENLTEQQRYYRSLKQKIKDQIYKIKKNKDYSKFIIKTYIVKKKSLYSIKILKP